MHYQVLARPYTPDGIWAYYPYWAPGRDANAAERLAQYAAQNGYEAAVVHSVTQEMLEAITRRVVERQDEQMLPNMRYLPTDDTRAVVAQRRLDQVTALLTISTPLHSDRGTYCASELDRRRLELELGAGGDVTKTSSWRPHRTALPRRMDVLARWLSMRARLEKGLVGGPADGTAI